MESTSKRFSMDKTDIKKVLIGLGVAVCGAALTYITQWVTGTSFNGYTPIVVTGWSVVANILRKFLMNYQGSN